MPGTAPEAVPEAATRARARAPDHRGPRHTHRLQRTALGPGDRVLGAPHALLSGADLPPEGVTVADAATGRADGSHREAVS